MTNFVRPIRIKGSVAYVPLTQGYEAVIDAADVPLVGSFNWYARVDPNTIYALRKVRIGPKQLTVRMHRVIMGEPDNLEVDHKDGNGLNNRRRNLRGATKSNNQHNVRIRRDNSSGFKGVSWCNRKKKWHARIALNKRGKHLGYFATAEAAYGAYCEASKKYHGEFGRVD